MPLVLVLLAIAALVALPFLSDLYTRPLRNEVVSVAEPGRNQVTRIHVALAVQGSALHDYIESRDTSLVRRFWAAMAEEDSALRALDGLADQMGRPARDRLNDLARQQDRWRAFAERDLVDTSAPSKGRAEAREQVFDDVLDAAARLDSTIDEAVRTKRQRIASAQRTQSRLALALGLIAIAAAFAVAWLGQRLQRATRDAESRRIALEHATEARARFVRGISHDLKNPLNAIDGHAQLLEDEVRGPISSDQRDSITRIRRSVRSVLSLIDDLLELSRVEAGQLAISLARTSLGDVVAETVEEHRAAAEATGHRMRLELAPEIPEVVTDEKRVRQVLGNLLSNAIKYTPGGGSIEIRIATRERHQRERGQWVAVDVRDSGPGIPAHMQESIFGEFARLAEHAARPGSGLGLAIARRIARLLGGDISVSNEADTGSCFTFWLPADARAHAARRGTDRLRGD